MHVKKSNGNEDLCSLVIEWQSQKEDGNFLWGFVNCWIGTLINGVYLALRQILNY